MTRFSAACALEARVQARHGIVGIAAALAVLWTLVLWAVPVQASGTVAAYLLFLDTAGFGALFAVVLLLLERTEGTRAALSVSPLRPGETVLVRVGSLTALALLVAVPMTAAASRGRPADLPWSLPLVLSGVALTSVLLLSVCLVVGVRRRSVQGFLLSVPLAVAPLLLVPLVHLTGLVRHPVVYAVPTTAGAELIRLGAVPGATVGSPLLWGTAVAYALLCAAAALPAAERALSSAAGGAEPGAGPRRRRPRRARASRRNRPTGRGSLPALVRFARVDLVGVGRDPLLLLVCCAPVPLALALRFLYPPAAELVRDTYGFDLAPLTPVLLAALVLLHVPMMLGMVNGLRAVEDGDEGILPALRVSPLSLRAYLAYRTVVPAVLSLLGLAAALPLSGLVTPGRPWGTTVALLLAAAQAALVTAVIMAWSRDRVAALVVAKGVGAVLTLTPVVVRVLPSPWNLALLVSPPSWVVLAVPGYDAGPLSPWACLIGGALVTAVAVWLLLRRAARRVDGRV
ncbi:fluoroquinolone export ABC transporter permease subunit [Nocardiopsis terrae]